MATVDFFISYTGADRRWAEWIAWVLEEAGHSIIIQAWDFRPGGNFVLDMDHAAKEAERTIAVLSDEYLKAAFPHPEWAAAFAPPAAGRAHLPHALHPPNGGGCGLRRAVRGLSHRVAGLTRERRAGEQHVPCHEGGRGRALRTPSAASAVAGRQRGRRGA